MAFVAGNVTLDMPGVRHLRIGRPIDDQIGPHFRFAERTGRFTDLLQCHQRRGMSRGGGGVDGGPQSVGERHGGALTFGRAA